ncbi:MAG: hypothetical protein ACOYU4_02525 [Thermodesulfobacteriota bacterium]
MSKIRRGVKIKWLPALISFFTLFFLASCAVAPSPRPERPQLTPKFTEFKLDAADIQDDLVFTAIRKDLEGKASILELMHFYMKELEKDVSPDSPYLRRLAWLFAKGRPVDIQGHYYGLTLVLRKGEHRYGGFLNRLWSATLSEASPWDGKIFEPAIGAELTEYTEGREKGALPTFMGINCFKEVWGSVWNVLSTEVLTFWLGLKDAPPVEKERYGYDKKGGLFIAHRGESVDHGNPGKQVLQLNYRWRNLKNPPPLRYLIDELVETADGLYLGQLLFATDNILKDYDPGCPAAAYKYEHFGYFLLMDDEWNKEKNYLLSPGGTQ